MKHVLMMGHYSWVYSNAFKTLHKIKVFSFTILLGIVHFAAYVVFKSSILLKRETNYRLDDQLRTLYLHH